MKTTLAIAMTLALGASALQATEAKGPNMADKTAAAAVTATAQAIDTLTMARQLADYGLAQQDPLALIVAARITRTTPTQPADYTKEGAGQGKAGADTLGSADYLLGQAREFSGGRAEVLALIDETAPATATRNTIGGPKAHTDRVNVNSTDLYRIKFEGGKTARVAVIGVGGDIDCHVYDVYGNLIDKDIDNTSTCVLSWTPRSSGSFKLKIKNYAVNGVDYLILTN